MQVPFTDPLLHLASQNTIVPLIGRALEMSLVTNLLATVAADKAPGPRALFLSGEVGIGKSRLLAEMYKQALAEGFTLLEARTYDMGNMFPYLPFIEALRPAIRSFTLEQLRRYTGLTDREGHAATSSLSLTGLPLVTALSQLFPEITSRLNLTPASQEVLSPNQEKFRLFDSIATLLEKMALDQPILLSVDNLQWADSASLELTMYLTVRLHRSRVALSGATRPTGFADEAAHAAMRTLTMLGELVRQGLLMYLPLSPLAEEEARQYIQHILPADLPEEVAQSLLQRSGGNPYFLEELARTLILREQLVLRDHSWRIEQDFTTSPLPSSITQAVGERLQGLQARELLQVAALFGHTFPITPLLQVCSTIAPAKARMLLEEARQKHIVTTMTQQEMAHHHLFPEQMTFSQTESYLVFCQGIVQEVLQSEMPEERSQELHGAIGAALETYYGTSVMDHAAELAHHYVQGACQQQALFWSLKAADESVRQQAHRESIKHLRVVVRLLEAGTLLNQSNQPLVSEIYVTLGESWLKLGELEQAGEAFRLALEKQPRSLAEQSLHLPLFLAKANRLLGDIYRLQGKYELALAHLQAASNLFEQNVEKESLSEQTHSIPSFWLSSGRSSIHLSQPLNRGNALPTTLTELDSTERLLLLQARSTLDILCFQPERAETHLWQSYQLATTTADRGGQAFALHMLGWLRGWGKEIVEATRLIEQARELYIACGDPFHSVLGDQSLGIIYQARGDMEKARFYNLNGFEQARRYGVQNILGWLHCNQGMMALTYGHWDECEKEFNQAFAYAERLNDIRLRALATQAQAMFYVRRGHWTQAEQTFQKALQAALQTEWYPSTLALYGHFLAVTGRESAALIQLERVSAEPEPFGYSGHFYVPFLAEAYLHTLQPQQARIYIERIRTLRSCCYYGVSVDRILGEVAAQQGDWQMAEQAFTEGIAFCQQTNNEPELATILYEQARSGLMRSRVEPDSNLKTRIYQCCEQARALFLKYDLQRSADLVDTLYQGVSQLDNRSLVNAPLRLARPQHLAHADYQLELHLTKRELEVLRLVAEGQTDREVADALVLSPRTVNRHLSNIFTKLDVPGRAAAVAYAIRLGLVK